MTVVSVLPQDDRGADHIIWLAAAAENGSEHPVARAIVEEARRRGLAVTAPEAFRTVPGGGVTAVVDGGSVAVGNPRWIVSLGYRLTGDLAATIEVAEADGCTVVVVGRSGEVEGAVALADVARPGAAAAVRELRRRGLRVLVVSGDNHRAVGALARELGVDEVVAEATPAGKVEIIDRLREDGRVVAFVGDGVNDAPALTASDVGMAVAAGTDVAVESAAVVLMRSDPRAVVTALALSRRAFRIIRQNLGWAFAYNLVAIPLAALGVLSPAACGVSMAVSSVGVMANSLRLARYTPELEEGRT
jgi:Cu+-exporting ATPase